MSGALLTLEGLTAGYDRAAVIRELDLTVGPGEVVALLGANGAGKTTTLRVISGLVRPMSGRVAFDGGDLVRTSPTKRARLGIVHVPEGRGIFYGLTVAEHFRLGYQGERPDEEVAYWLLPEAQGLTDSARRAPLGRRAADAGGRARSWHGDRAAPLDELSLGLAPIIVEGLLPVVHQYALDAVLRRAARGAAHPARARHRGPRLRALRTARSSCTTARRRCRRTESS